jgi:hypothetical protein
MDDELFAHELSGPQPDDGVPPPAGYEAIQPGYDLRYPIPMQTITLGKIYEKAMEIYKSFKTNNNNKEEFIKLQRDNITEKSRQINNTDPKTTESITRLIEITLAELIERKSPTWYANSKQKAILARICDLMS